jgi:uncharacterized protein with HEPN domain
MKKDPKIFLQHIIESIEEIEKYTCNQNKVKFSKATMMQDAVMRRLEIIGEAVKNIPKSYKNKYPKISWREIAGMRDILIHEYFGININIVWNTIQKDIPKLKKSIQELMNEL